MMLVDQIRNYIFILIASLFTSCGTERRPEDVNGNTNEKAVNTLDTAGSTISGSTVVTEISGHIESIFQDKKSNYWFGTNGEGVFRYDGKTLLRFSIQNGLFNNTVNSIQEDNSGYIWFGTGGGICRFDGQMFETIVDRENTRLNNRNSNNPGNTWTAGSNDLWFGAGEGAYRYHDSLFSYLRFPEVNLIEGNSAAMSPYSAPLSPYTVYCTLKDSKGNLWFGTQSMGVCRYNPSFRGQSAFTWFTEKELSGPAVRGLFEDSKGNMWFGNNGGGLFCYDGRSIRNITTENGLSNEDFYSYRERRISDKARPGTLARVWTINEACNGDILIGTVDSGVWRFDGNNLINYTTNDGLTSNAINIIYKDKNGELWFGTDGAGICKFDGIRFTRFVVN